MRRCTLHEFLAIHAAWVRAEARLEDRVAVALAHVLGALGAARKTDTIGDIARRILGRNVGDVPGEPKKPEPDRGLSADASVAFMKLFMAQRGVRTTRVKEETPPPVPESHG